MIFRISWSSHVTALSACVRRLATEHRCREIFHPREFLTIFRRSTPGNPPTTSTIQGHPSPSTAEVASIQLALVMPDQELAFYEAAWTQSATIFAARYFVAASVSRITITRLSDGEEWGTEITDRATIQALVNLAQTAPYEPERWGTQPLSCDGGTEPSYHIVFCAELCLSEDSVAVTWYPEPNILGDGFGPPPNFGSIIDLNFESAVPMPTPIVD
jgi:hypothetical protein